MRVVGGILMVVGWMAVTAGDLPAQSVPPTQGLRSVGGGPSTTFRSNLPTNSIDRTLGYAGGYTSASEFTAAPTAFGGSYVTPAGIDVNLMQGRWQAGKYHARAPRVGVGVLAGLKVRTIDSLNFDKRQRLAKLRETSLALIERIRNSDVKTAEQLSLGFREFMFPFPVEDRKALGYGFFSQMDVVGGGTASPSEFLTPFTEEVQRSLAAKEFIEVTQAMVLGRELPEGLKLDGLQTAQLAALGNFLFNNSRYQAAEAVWTVLAERDPSSSVAHRALALCLFASGQGKRAAVEARRSVTAARWAAGAEAQWPEALKVTGSNWLDVFPRPRDLSEARAELDAQLQAQPDDPDLKFMAGYADLFTGQWKAAEETLASLGDQDEAAKALVTVLRNKGVAPTVEQAAVPDVRNAIEKMTGLEEPIMSEAERRQLAEALREGATSYDDLMRIGDFRFFMGNFTMAGEAYRAAHKLKPEDPFARFMLVHACYANGELRQATRYLKAALAIEPNWGLYEFRLQEFYGDMSEYEHHLKNLERQVELRPSDVDMKFLLAYVYYYSGRYTDAARLLAEVVQAEPASTAADYFLRLARLQG